MTIDTTYISECCGVSLTGGRCSSCWEGCVGEEVEIEDEEVTDKPKEETTYGEDMDAFIAKYIVPEDVKLAMLELQMIVLKAERATMEECYKKFSASLSSL